MVVPFSSQTSIGNKYISTQIEAEDTLECGSDGRLVVAEVVLRLHAWLDVIEEVHELVTSGVSRHLIRIERDPGMLALFKAPTLVTFPLRKISRFDWHLETESMKCSGRPGALSTTRNS